MNYACYDEQSGTILGFYADEVNNSVPINSIPISYDQWEDCLRYPDNKMIDVVNKILIIVAVTPITAIPYPNWREIFNGLRGTALFSKTYLAAKAKASIQTPLMLLISVLTAPNPNLEDVQFALTDLKAELGESLTAKDIIAVNELLAKNHCPITL